MSRYWSIERCDWVPCPAPVDALATPWSGVDLPVPPPPPAAHPADVVGLPRPVAAVPPQRPAVHGAPVAPQ